MAQNHSTVEKEPRRNDRSRCGSAGGTFPRSPRNESTSQVDQKYPQCLGLLELRTGSASRALWRDACFSSGLKTEFVIATVLPAVFEARRHEEHHPVLGTSGWVRRVTLSKAPSGFCRLTLIRTFFAYVHFSNPRRKYYALGQRLESFSSAGLETPLLEFVRLHST